jgi:hypothetical protein
MSKVIRLETGEDRRSSTCRISPEKRKEKCLTALRPGALKNKTSVQDAGLSDLFSHDNPVLVLAEVRLVI